jgi:hypothetical protein
MNLDQLLGQWADRHQLTNSEAVAIRSAVIHAETELDADWLWQLLEPVTNLLDRHTRLVNWTG